MTVELFNMNKIISIVAVLIMFLFFIWSIDHTDKQKKTRDALIKKKIEQITKLSIEYAFYQGQVSALTNDVRVKLDTNLNVYVWSRNPWDSISNVDAVIFQPKESLKLEFFSNRILSNP
jgi:hypothetical protein